ncbi:MAG: endo alpha-1,4 polygalactosaminidase, partial [Demequinaceae bacterium]|nr:endo alpha-1,4 polygalactosaminidase [Demequinaceae bacterium]
MVAPRVRRSRAIILAVTTACLVVACAPAAESSPSASPNPTASPTPLPSASLSASPSATLLYDPLPPPGTPWQIRLDGGVPDDPDARIVEVDWQAPEDLVRWLHEGGAYTVCYMSAGTVEEFRLDAGDFPDEVVGRGLPD